MRNTTIIEMSLAQVDLIHKALGYAVEQHQHALTEAELDEMFVLHALTDKDDAEHYPTCDGTTHAWTL